MRRLIIVLFFLILSVLVGIKIAQDPGYALFSYKHWSMEMPLWFAITSALIFLILLYFIFKLFNKIGDSFADIKTWYLTRKHTKALKRTSRGLLDLIEEKWQHAEKNFLKTVSYTPEPIINYLGAAIATHESKEYVKRDEYLQKATKITPFYEIPIGIVQARFLIQQKKFEQAYVILNHLHQISPKHRAILALLERVYLYLFQWENALKLLPLLYKTKVIDASEYEIREQHLYEMLMKASVEKKEGAESLRMIYANAPKKLKNKSEFFTFYITQLSRFPETALECELLIKSALKQSWNKELVILFGKINSDSKKQLALAENWLKRYGGNASIFLTLGRLATREKLWGKAKAYFEDGLKTSPSVELYHAYGDLLEKLSEKDSALTCYKKALDLIKDT